MLRGDEVLRRGRPMACDPNAAFAEQPLGLVLAKVSFEPGLIERKAQLRHGFSAFVLPLAKARIKGGYPIWFSRAAAPSSIISINSLHGPK